MVEEPLYVREVTASRLPELVSRNETAFRLGVSLATVDRLVAQGRLEKMRVSDGRVMITVESVERHLARLNGSPVDAPAPAAAAVPRKLEALRTAKAARAQASPRRRRRAVA